MTIVEWVNQILVYKTPWENFDESEHKTFSPFIVNRWLSMVNDFIEIVNFFQKYSIGLLEPKDTYKWYCDVLPKGKRFNRYIKGKVITVGNLVEGVKNKDVVYYDKHAGHGITYNDALYQVITLQNVALVE